MIDANPMRALRYLHTIHAARDCQRLRNIYCDIFGGLVFSENFYPPEDREAALLYVADHMIEVMAPRRCEDLNYMFARYLQKMGPSWHSISFKIDDCVAARAHCERKGIRVNTTGPGLIFLHPKSTGGIVMELTDHRMPNDPWELPNWRRDWAYGRPSRPHAIDSIVCAPRNPAAAIAFLEQVLGGIVGYSSVVQWPQRATATSVDVADATLLILDPADRSAGPLADFSNGPNAGVYALAWTIADPDASAKLFAQNGIGCTSVSAESVTHEVVLEGARHWFGPDT